MIAAWKKHATERMAGVFSGRSEAAEIVREGEIGRLHAKIGQLVVERDFLESLRSLSLERRRQMIEPQHARLSVQRQCRLVSISRSRMRHCPACSPR